jgi:predicted CoA-binding protein
MKTLVVGASTNPERYAYKATKMLLAYGHSIELLGQKSGEIDHHNIHIDLEPLAAIDTVTMYVGAKNQVTLYEYLIGLHPRRIIFNPGAENPTFAKKAIEAGIEVEEACTLVLLSTGQY